MTHKIIGFNAETGQVVIRYSDSAPPIAVDLPIDEHGLFPTGDELNSYLSGFIPFVDTRRKDALAAGVANAHEIAALVSPEVRVDVAPAADEAALAAVQSFEDAEFDAKLSAALVRLGISV